MAQLCLYIDGMDIAYQDIYIPEFADMSFEDRVDFRKLFLESQVQILKLNYSRAIQERGGRYNIFLIISSKHDDLQIPMDGKGGQQKAPAEGSETAADDRQADR